MGPLAFNEILVLFFLIPLPVVALIVAYKVGKKNGRQEERNRWLEQAFEKRENKRF